MPTALLRAAPTTRPDPATTADVARLTGVRLDDATVRRGPAVDAAARAMGMAAFTYDGIAHLPDRHGPVGTPASRELLAHELTHVAQHVRATLDPAYRPPDPYRPSDTQRSRDELEAEARDVARRISRTAPEADQGRAEPPPSTDTTHALGSTTTPPDATKQDDVPDDASLDRQARLLYPRVRALLDADLARDRQRAGRHPAGR